MRRKKTRPRTQPTPPEQPGSPLAPPRRSAWLGPFLVLFVLPAAAGTWWSYGRLGYPISPTRDEIASPGPPSRRAAYVDNNACLGCHEEEGRLWQDSHHARTMAAAVEGNVLGDFGDRKFTLKGVTSRFFKRGDRFFVNTEGEDGRTADFEIAYTFGVAPLQQYLVSMPGGRLQPLSTAWDVSNQEWFHLLPKEDTPPGDVLHWTGRYQTANTMCLVCHTTNFEKRYDPETDTFASRWAEPNVSCQGCHGPGDRHIEFETRRRGAGTPMHFPFSEPRGLTVDSKEASARQKTELCAPCHSRRSELVPAPSPGEPFLDSFLPSLLVRGLYHPDGQQLDEVYVDGSFRQSLMFQRGVTCTDCHNPHTGNLKLAGNAVCLQCHGKDPNPNFPTAAGDFDSLAHHFHQAGSPGAQCVNCHMPSTTYMRIQRRPDHSIRIPRPDISVKIATPDACTSCHRGRNAQWAAKTIVRWYGPGRKQGTHYGEAFAAARSGEPGARDALARIISDRQSPAIVRASALAELSVDPSTGVGLRMEAARDRDPEIRTAAADSAGGLPPPQRIQILGPLLTDRIRAVRIAAARSLSSMIDQLTPEVRRDFDPALAEYVTAQTVSLDMPGAPFNLAVVYENVGQRDLAERQYLAALRIDPDFAPARANLAQLYNAMSRNAEAERVLRDGLERRPQEGELQYLLGLLLAGDKRLKEASEVLAKAAQLLPGSASVQYNYGIALQQMGQNGQAADVLLVAEHLDPEDPAIPYALTILYAQSGRKDEALKWAQRVRSLRPGDPGVEHLMASLRLIR